MVNNSTCAADIGCDHAYMPIYLIRQSLTARVLACDINEGPCQKARENIVLYGLSDKIKVIRTDGLCGIEKFAPDHIIICGMGGELISKIIADSEYTKISTPKLIMNPMTKPEVLRKFLALNGYSIVNEEYVLDDRIYQIICAQYTGKIKKLTKAQALVGEKFPKENLIFRGDYIQAKINSYKKIVQCKKSSGADCTEEINLIKELEIIYEDNNAL